MDAAALGSPLQSDSSSVYYGLIREDVDINTTFSFSINELEPDYCTAI